jgi:serine/threonine protein kinase
MSSARAKEIFLEALALTPEERTAFVIRACAGDASLKDEVEDLLKTHDEAGQFMSRPNSDRVTNATHRTAIDGKNRGAAELQGSMIGRYKLLEQIGEGGFGTVWMAEQREPVTRRVALKIIKLGMDTKQVIARFEAERQALAIMDHPNIAKVLDAGATETGRPYFVMELVKGVPITQYCDAQNLSAHDRLELFISVCQAVQHAHQKGIIHRDIKPSNVLVSQHDDKPVVKIIDFGIAKATAARLTEKTVFTEFRQMIGTPAYMSPEQAGLSDLDIDTRTDVYSLGVLLYELLTGTTPFEIKTLLSAGYAEIQRIIREVEPPTPSTRLSTMKNDLPSIAANRKTEPAKLTRLVRGDLDWIVMKALEKDRSRRYDSASDLGADIQRYLTGDPVYAAPPSAAYRLRKFVRRNKGTVTAGSTVVAALVVGVIAFAWQARIASNQRDLAIAAQKAEAQQRRIADSQRDRAVAAESETRQRVNDLQKVTDFQASQLSDIDTELMGVRLRNSILEQRRRAFAAKKND